MAFIALIDDDATEALILSGFLELGSEGHKLVHFTEFSSFEASLGSNRPDLVFLDRRLPPIDNFDEGLSKLLSTGWSGPVVLLTASLIGHSAPTTNAIKFLGPIEKSDLLTDTKLHKIIRRGLAL
jgi:DNA-binding NtrC family response regulator